MKILAIAALALAGAALAGFVAHASGSKAATVTVTEKEFHISLSARTAPVGVVHFVIKNTGRDPHALAIAGPGVRTRTPTIAPGKTARLVVTLKKGGYTIWCPIPGHAALGMKTSIHAGAATTVTPVDQPATTGAGTDTSTEPGAPWG